MPALPSAEIDEVMQSIMSLWSAFAQDVPIDKSELNDLVVHVDTKLDSTEQNIFSGLPQGPERDWIIANPTMGRWIMEEIERKRREVL